jgi:hypothetical protein
MDNSPIYSPKLIEPGVKYFLTKTLKDCQTFKNRHETILFNFYMFVLFFLVFGGFLYYHYKGKLTPYDLELKNRKKQEYIISKLQQIAYLRKNQGIITSLPQW